MTPPSIPNFHNPRGSGSSFGSDLSYAEDAVNSHPMSTFSRAPNGESSSSSPGKNGLLSNFTMNEYESIFHCVCIPCKLLVVDNIRLSSRMPRDLRWQQLISQKNFPH